MAVRGTGAAASLWAWIARRRSDRCVVRDVGSAAVPPRSSPWPCICPWPCRRCERLPKTSSPRLSRGRPGGSSQSVTRRVNGPRRSGSRAPGRRRGRREGGSWAVNAAAGHRTQRQALRSFVRLLPMPCSYRRCLPEYQHTPIGYDGPAVSGLKRAPSRHGRTIYSAIGWGNSASPKNWPNRSLS